MTSAPLNTAEKTLLREWIADQAYGYNKSTVQYQGPNGKTLPRLAPLTGSDLAAISALDNDVVRGYMADYQTLKLQSLNAALTQQNTNATNAQVAVANTQAQIAALSAIAVQPTQAQIAAAQAALAAQTTAS